MHPQSRFVFVWGFLIASSLCVMACMIVAIVYRCYPTFPCVPGWLWMMYLGIQVLNRIPVGWEWKSDAAHVFALTLFVFGGAMFALAMLDRIALGRFTWTLAAMVLAMGWLARVGWSASEKIADFPLPNRLVGALAGGILDLPLVVVSAMAAETAT